YPHASRACFPPHTISWFNCYVQNGRRRDLRSFPTRRSSDLLLDESRSLPLAINEVAIAQTNNCFIYKLRLLCKLIIWRNLIFPLDRKSTRLNSSHVKISYAVFCLKKKKRQDRLR